MSLNSPATHRSDAAAALSRPHSRRWALLRAVARALLGSVAVALSLLLVAWLTLHWIILPHIERWRDPLQARASQALGVPVTIGGITVRSSGWVPSFELRDVALHDAEGRTALHLPRVYAALSPRSLLAFELRFAQLLVDGAALDVRRAADGRVFVAGLELGRRARSDADGAASGWLFRQQELVIRGGSLRWLDEARSAPPLALDDVQIVVRNGLRRHDIRIDATPPPAWGERFTLLGRFTQPLLARPGDWSRWRGAVYVDAPRVDLQALRRHVTLPFDLDEGAGAVRAWFDVDDGTVTGVTTDLALRAVRLRLGAQVEPLVVQEVEGRLVAQRDAEGFAIAAQNLGFLTGDALRWPRGDWRLAWRQPAGQPASGGEFTAQRLDLGVMAQIASRLPLDASWRRALAEWRPAGRIDDLAARWDGPLEAPERYRLKARASALSLAAGAAAEPRGLGRPGLRQAELTLDATEAGGSARLGLAGGSIEFPGVFEEPRVGFDRLAAEVTWKVDADRARPNLPPRLSVQVRDARFANADAAGDFSLQWQTGSGAVARYPGQLQLDARLSSGLAQRAHRYLPLALPPATRRYVEQAVGRGRITAARVAVKGDLARFPFFPAAEAAAVGTPRGSGRAATSGAAAAAAAAAAGEFRIEARIEDAAFAFLPDLPGRPASPWPTLTNASVDLALDRNVLAFRNGRARLGRIEWSGVAGALRPLDGDALLAFDGTAQGPLDDMLRVVAATPIRGWINGTLDDASATGAAELTLAFGLPLARPEAATVQGSVGLRGNDLRLGPGTPLLAAARGRVDFTQQRFGVVGGAARLYGGEISFDGGSQADGSVRFDGQGTATAEGLRRGAELGLLQTTAQWFSGQAAYRANLGFVRGRTEIGVTSNLVGLASELPPPLRKAADVPLALRYETRVEPAPAAAASAGRGAGAGSAPAARDTLRLELGGVLQALYLRDLSGAEARVLRGGIGVFEPAPQPLAGVAVNARLEALSVDAWATVAERFAGPAGGGAAGTAAVGTGATAAAGFGGDPPAGGYLPDSLALRVQLLSAGPRRLSQVAAGLSHAAGAWRANVQSNQLAGYLEYRAPRGGGSAGAGGRVMARLARLTLPKSEVEQVESLLDRPSAGPARALPALDIVVDDLELRGKRLGRLEIEGLSRATAAGGGAARDALRDWQLTKFNLTTPEARFVSTGAWTAAGSGPAARRSVIDFSLDVDDSGALLARLGTPGAIRGGKGRLVGQASWAGTPFALDYPSLAGQVNLAIDAGQFLKADPGAARLLGVLSLQALPRRLSLDFRDVFQQGFAFDSITGDATIAGGVATTRNLRMRGVQALVLMEGQADIARETQALRVVVVPEINAGTAALAYAVINPAIGLGAFLAQALLRKPLMEANTREFRVSGSWAESKVERVDRKSGEVLAETPAAADVPTVPSAAAPSRPPLPLPPQPMPPVPAPAPAPAPATPVTDPRSP